MPPDHATTPTVGILMPAYNESATIATILAKVLDLDIVSEVVVVDDCSTDETSSIVQEINDGRIVLHKQERNGGKTAAIKKAIELSKSDILLIQDADLEYDPSEIPAVLDPILSGNADMVYGSRFLVRKAARVLYYYHYLANKFLTMLSNTLTNVNMTDIETCYKACRAPILKRLPLTSKGFGMEVEITALASQIKGIRIYEVPISYYGRTYEEGKKIGLTDGIHAIWYILYYNIIGRRLPSGRRYLSSAHDDLKSTRPSIEQ